MDIDVTTRPTRHRAKARAPCGPCNTIVLQTPNIWNREYLSCAVTDGPKLRLPSIYTTYRSTVLYAPGEYNQSYHNK